MPTYLTRLAAVVVGATTVSAAAAFGASFAVGGISASSGDLKAHLSYIELPSQIPQDQGLHLTVLDRERLVVDVPVTAPPYNTSSNWEISGLDRSHTLFFRDLNNDGSPELVLQLFSGGAHCCTVMFVYDFDRVKPTRTIFNFGDPVPTLQTRSGHVIFRSADDAFAYAFTDYADSGLPIQIWEYTHARFADVTRDYPTMVTSDASSWWRYYLKAAASQGDVRGILAAWAADEALLGHAVRAKETLLQLAFKGTLDRGGGAPKGSTYIRQLWSLLEKRHYLP